MGTRSVGEQKQIAPHPVGGGRRGCDPYRPWPTDAPHSGRTAPPWLP
jgi:hypothetical protein